MKRQFRVIYYDVVQKAVCEVTLYSTWASVIEAFSSNYKTLEENIILVEVTHLKMGHIHE